MPALLAVLMTLFAAAFIGLGSMKWMSPAFAHAPDPGCTTVGVGTDIRGEFAGTTDEAAIAQVGDTLDYTVTVSLTDTQCPITDGVVNLTLPDGTVVAVDAALALDRGETTTYTDVASYIVAAADIGTQGAPAGFVRATTDIEATSHRASGIDQQVSASTNFDTFIATALQVSGQAAPEFTQTFPWEITKSVDPDSWNLFEGDTGTSGYTVTATKGEPTESDFAVSGSFSVFNPNTIDVQVEAIAEQLTGSSNLIVDCGVTLPTTIGAGDTLECTFTADLPDAAPRMFTAEITAGFGLGGTATANIDFTGVEPTEVVNDEVTISDTNTEFGDPAVIADDTTFEYDMTFDCEGVEFSEGHGSFTHENTATIEETGQTATANVMVDCYQLNVTKDVAGEMDVTYDWQVLKTGDPATQTINQGETADVMWTVTVDLEATIPGEVAISGQITIDNPNPDRDAILTEVSDEIGGLVATVDCGGPAPYTVPAGGMLVCDYDVTGEPTALENVATAVQQNYDYDALGVATESGTTEYTGAATLAEGDIVVTAIDFCVNVTDVELALNETVCADAMLPAVFSGTLTYGPEGLVCGENIVTNTATIIEQDSQETATSTATVTIVVECEAFAGCTPGFWKNHPEAWQGFDPDQTLASAGFVFPASLSDFGEVTLMEALQGGGGKGLEGGATILLRAAVASLLNADHDGVNFEMTEAEIITAVNAALATEDRDALLALASELDGLNNTGCSINGNEPPIEL